MRKVEIHDGLKFGETSIKGVVISDFSHGNFESEILAVQEAGKLSGILLELTNAINYESGEEIDINLDGATLHYVNGELRVKNLSAVNVAPTGNKIDITPHLSDIATIAAESQFWGPVLVAVEEVTFTAETGTIGGENTIDDDIVSAKLTVLESADFYNEKAPEGFAQVIGINRTENDVLKVYPRSMEDLALLITELKEDFENDTSTTYDNHNLNLRTGSWRLSGGITAGTTADLKFGSQSIRLRGDLNNELRDGILEMQFDLQGVKGVRLSHGIYPASAEVSNVNPTTLDLEISYDQGSTYEFVASFTIDINSEVLITEEVTLDTADPDQNVRFRLVNSSVPFANNRKPRISIDDVIFLY
ncbi:hypothetical protein DN748_13700 [Sinomicrobium soli]|nr:hypothetical protein DN748_13700 [Sinomicrobium sp. N-1-3-6]